MNTSDNKAVYSVNDFDHIGFGAVDLDLKRLATSTVLWARERGASVEKQRAAVEQAALSYFDTVNYNEAMQDSDIYKYER